MNADAMNTTTVNTLTFAQPPTLPTATFGDNTFKIATTSYIQNNLISALTTNHLPNTGNISLSGIKNIIGNIKTTNLQGVTSLTIGDSGDLSLYLGGLSASNGYTQFIMRGATQAIDTTWKYVISALSTPDTALPCRMIQSGSIDWVYPTTPIVFPKSFGTNVPTLVVSPANNIGNFTLSIQGLTSTGANVRGYSAPSANGKVFWIAVSA